VVARGLARRQDRIIAVSRATALDINRHFGVAPEKIEVIPNGIDHDRFQPGDAAAASAWVAERHNVTRPFFLYVARLEHPAKNHVRLVEAFTRLNKKLVVIGDGAELARLKKLAGPTITFTGRASLQQLQEHFSACRALVFPGQEDFGIVPLEVMAAGRPVIAYGRGGALETVIDGQTGIFFDDQSTDALVAAVERFEAMGSQFEDRAAIRAHAQRFSTESFKSKIHAFIATKLLGIQAGPRLDDAADPDRPLPYASSKRTVSSSSR